MPRRVRFGRRGEYVRRRGRQCRLRVDFASRRGGGCRRLLTIQMGSRFGFRRIPGGFRKVAIEAGKFAAADVRFDLSSLHFTTIAMTLPRHAVSRPILRLPNPISFEIPDAGGFPPASGS